MIDRKIRLKEVMNITGLGKTTIYGMVDRGEFPKQIQISKRCVAWQESKIKAFSALMDLTCKYIEKKWDEKKWDADEKKYYM